ncbi:MAG: ATP synthase F1 subunit epsilon [Alphaproteobacteria bacterium]
MAATFPLTIVSPAKAIFSGEVAQVEIPGREGDFGVLPGHAPFFSMIRPGVIHIHGNADARFFVTSGYAEVSPTGTTILSDHIEDLATVDVAETQKALEAAQGALDIAEGDEEKRAAQKRIESAQALLAALGGSH